MIEEEKKTEYKQKKYSVTFRDSSKEEQELFIWVRQKSKIIGIANFIKQTLYNAKLQEEREGK